MRRTKPDHDAANPSEQLVPAGFAGARILVEHGVTQVGLIRSRGAWRQRHWLRGHWLIYTAQGNSNLRSGGARFDLRARQLWLLPAGLTVDWRGGPRPWQAFRVALDPTGRWEHLAGKMPREIPAGQAHRIFYCVEGLVQEAYGPHYPDHTVIGAHYAGALAIFLDRRLEFDRGGGFWTRNLHDLWARVAAHLGARWTIPRLATGLGVSTPHFHRLCQTHYGETPHRILLRMRMEAAHGHVLEGRFTLDHIAELTGYADAFALSKAFKRCHGRSPGHLRRRTQTEAARSVSVAADGAGANRTDRVSG